MLTGDDLVRLRVWSGVGGIPADRRQAVFTAMIANPRAKTVKADELLIVDVSAARRHAADKLKVLDEAERVIKRDKAILGGEPAFLGTRAPVYGVAAMLEAGTSPDDILSGYPSLQARHLDLARIWAAAHPRRIARGMPGARFIRRCARALIACTSSATITLDGGRMSKKHLIAAVIAVALLFLGAYAGSPLLAANSLKSAAQSGDADKLQRLVDFPAVRESLKGQLNAMILQSIQSDPDLKDNPFAGFAAVMAPALVNQVIESYVTAEGLSTMMAANRPVAAAPGADPKAMTGPPGGGATAAPTAHTPRFEHRYKDLDTYVITSVSADDPKSRFSFVLHRRGLFDWRLTRIELPKAMLANSAAPEAPAPEPEASRPAEPSALLARWGAENEACRGGSGDDPATEKACESRDQTDSELQQAGWCYGENAAYGYQSEWRPCGAPRFASTAEAEAAAEADQAAHTQ